METVEAVETREGEKDGGALRRPRNWVWFGLRLTRCGRDAILAT